MGVGLNAVAAAVRVVSLMLLVLVRRGMEDGDCTVSKGSSEYSVDKRDALALSFACASLKSRVAIEAGVIVVSSSETTVPLGRGDGERLREDWRARSDWGGAEIKGCGAVWVGCVYLRI